MTAQAIFTLGGSVRMCIGTFSRALTVIRGCLENDSKNGCVRYARLPDNICDRHSHAWFFELHKYQVNRQTDVTSMRMIATRQEKTLVRAHFV
jgi:hypothetical protein